MAVKLDFINLIVPNITLEAVFIKEGGFNFFKQSYGMLREMVWYDDAICRLDGDMNWLDVDDLVDCWVERGLAGLVDLDAGKQWKDFCKDRLWGKDSRTIKADSAFTDAAIISEE